MAYAWKQAINQGIHIETTWMEIQEIMVMETFQEYYQYIANYPAITLCIKLHLDLSTGIIHYRPIT